MLSSRELVDNAAAAEFTRIFGQLVTLLQEAEGVRLHQRMSHSPIVKKQDAIDHFKMSMRALAVAIEEALPIADSIINGSN